MKSRAVNKRDAGLRLSTKISTSILAGAVGMTGVVSAVAAHEYNAKHVTATSTAIKGSSETGSTDHNSDDTLTTTSAPTTSTSSNSAATSSSSSSAVVSGGS